VAARAGLSEKVFREVFATLEACYESAFDAGLERLARVVDEAAGREVAWLDRLRAGLVAFLGFLDDEPAWARLLIAPTPLADGVLGLRCQQRVLGVVTCLLDDHRPGPAGESGPRIAAAPGPESTLTAELLAGGAVSVIRAQLLNGQPKLLVGLAPSLMSFIVRPYLGDAAATAELEGRPATPSERLGQTSGEGPAHARAQAVSRATGLPIRATRRTTLVLHAIARAPYSNNREIAQAAGLADEGQASKLLARLERKGVIENVGVGAARGEPNAWLLTASGRRAVELLAASVDAGSLQPGSTPLKETA
jgi:AcrR family transcriptional regulator